MHTEKKRLLALVLPIIVLLAISACAPAAPPPAATATKAPAAAPTAAPKAAAPTTAPAKPKELVKLKVATPHPGTPETGVAAIAAAVGYFKEEGVDVEFVTTKGGGDTVQAVQVPGGADVGLLTGPMSVLGAIEKGADLVIISASVTPGDQRWITTKDSPYKSIKDLAGKPVGYTTAGSSSNLYLLGILEKEGVKAEAVAAGALGGNMWTQIKTGQIAAGISTPPDAWVRIEQEGARVLFATTDYPEFANYSYIVNFARGDSVKNKPEGIKGFLNGWKRAAELIAKDPVAATKAYMPNTEIPEDQVVRYFKDIPPTKFRLAPIGGMDISVKYAKQFNFITKDPDISKVVNLSMAPQ
ncbi:MAG TPA: ABC transporter substrate-binding protein [Dehalococcoidia bacterium]|nr:ABC transporter substrate-binding protein [Dehalococcoidia bacterium]